MATASPARDESASYVAWGHSSVVNPWSVLSVSLMTGYAYICMGYYDNCALFPCRGEVIAKAGSEESVVYADIGIFQCFTFT